MPTFQLFITTESPSDAASLVTWLRRQQQDVTVVSAEGKMGAPEALSAALGGSAALRAFALIAREWIRAHRTRISIEVEGRGQFVVEGTTDIDDLVALLAAPASDGETHA
jgi:hypothetical protein